MKIRTAQAAVKAVFILQSGERGFEIGAFLQEVAELSSSALGFRRRAVSDAFLNAGDYVRECRLPVGLG